MDLGFETCGNASVIAFDRGIPVLVTDPWIEGAQYFGSWSLPYRFTEVQQEAFREIRHAWISHGHPDHLNLASLEHFRDKELLVPQHYGGRIARDLASQGFKVREVPTGQWVSLSDRVRILCTPDWNQDAALLIALGDRCGVLNLNDSQALGNRPKLRRELARFPRRFVLGLINYGDADMMNFFDEDGRRIPPNAARRRPLGFEYNALLRRWNGTHTAPFSCHHVYTRTDSLWAREFETPLTDHAKGFNPSLGELMPGNFRYDAEADRAEPTPMERSDAPVLAPRDLGDDWSETLEREEVAELESYFAKFERLRGKFAFLSFRVGGRTHSIALDGPKGRGITFEVPRGSLMTAIRYEIFDDLLIGNFMKTTLHGGLRSLYPDFSPYVAKYGDNGRAFTRRDLEDYHAHYLRASGFDGWVERLRRGSSVKLRSALSASPGFYRSARRLYGYYKYLRSIPT